MDGDDPLGRRLEPIGISDNPVLTTPDDIVAGAGPTPSAIESSCHDTSAITRNSDDGSERTAEVAPAADERFDLLNVCR